MAVVAGEGGGEDVVGHVLPQVAAEDQAEVGVECDQAPVECGVVQAGEAKAKSGFTRRLRRRFISRSEMSTLRRRGGMVTYMRNAHFFGSDSYSCPGLPQTALNKMIAGQSGPWLLN